MTTDLRLGVGNHRLRTAHRLSKKRVYQKLVRVEVYADLNAAVGRERYLKRLPRRSLELIITADNPTWAPISINALIRGDQQVLLST